MQYSLILFDFDGTLIDSDQMLKAAFLQLYAIYRPTYHPRDEVFLSFSGPPLSETLPKEFPDVPFEEVYQKYLEISPKFYKKYVTLYPGAKELLLRLKQRHIFVGLITSKRRLATEMTLEMLKINNIFDVVITPDDVKKMKPAPESIFKAMNLLNISDKNSVLYVGDSQYDYLTSENAGVDFALVDWSPRKNSFANFAKFIVHDFASFEIDIHL